MKAIKNALSSCLFFAAFIAAATPAFSMKVCNSSHEMIHMALGRAQNHDPAKVTTVGWYHFPRESCMDFPDLARKQYIYMKGDQGSIWSGRNGAKRKTLCVRSDHGNFRLPDEDLPFDATDEAACKAQGYEMVVFGELDEKGMNATGGKATRVSVTFINSTAYRMNLIVGFKRPNGNYETYGHFALNDKRTIDFGTDPNVRVFFRATAGRSYWGTDLGLCIDQENAFHYKNAATMPCDEGNQKRANFNEIKIDRGLNDYSMELTLR